ncbi:hypothetical protein, partial [Campylobacter troglodytis]|uniref:hypothetical protein n=1 Tax=Campylobacter troglodytis TaxID=654363 RepID=UPI001157AEA4
MKKLHSLKLKELDGNNFWLLLSRYQFNDTKYINLSPNELAEYFCKQDLKIYSMYPQVNDTLNFKGKLRISWSFDVKYNKNIDLIFFPQNNP